MKPGSPAALSGLWRGHRILKLNSRVFDDLTIDGAMKKLEDTTVLSLDVIYDLPGKWTFEILPKFDLFDQIQGW